MHSNAGSQILPLTSIPLYPSNLPLVNTSRQHNDHWSQTPGIHNEHRSLPVANYIFQHTATSATYQHYPQAYQHPVLLPSLQQITPIRYASTLSPAPSNPYMSPVPLICHPAPSHITVASHSVSSNRAISLPRDISPTVRERKLQPWNLKSESPHDSEMEEETEVDETNAVNVNKRRRIRVSGWPGWRRKRE